METIVTIIRNTNTDIGSEGILYCRDFHYSTLELPWKENQRNISCIPSGIYNTSIIESKKFGVKYLINNVYGRSEILIHSGNFAGDESLGYKTDTSGCILLGKDFGFIDNQKAILSSREAVREFMAYLNNQPFILNIIVDYSLKY